MDRESLGVRALTAALTAVNLIMGVAITVACIGYVNFAFIRMTANPIPAERSLQGCSDTLVEAHRDEPQTSCPEPTTLVDVKFSEYGVFLICHCPEVNP